MIKDRGDQMDQQIQEFRSSFRSYVNLVFRWEQLSKGMGWGDIFRAGEYVARRAREIFINEFEELAIDEIEKAYFKAYFNQLPGKQHSPGKKVEKKSLVIIGKDEVFCPETGKVVRVMASPQRATGMDICSGCGRYVDSRHKTRDNLVDLMNLLNFLEKVKDQGILL